MQQCIKSIAKGVFRTKRIAGVQVWIISLNLSLGNHN